MRRTTEDNRSRQDPREFVQIIDASFWTALRSIKNDAPLNLGDLNVALIAVRIQANDQLNGVLDTLNCTVEPLVQVWDGVTLTRQTTRNPAWAFLDMITGQANARARPTSEVDLDALKQWADEVDELGLTFDAIYEDQQSVWDRMQDATSSGRASPTKVSGRWSVVHDKPRLEFAPVQQFTPRNSTNFQSTKLFTEAPHAVKVRFPNELHQRQFDEIIVYADGYNGFNATRFETLDLPFTGVASQAWVQARYFEAAAKLRPEIYSIETDVEHIVC